MKFFSILDKFDVAPHAGEKVIKADAFETLLEVKELLDKAKEEIATYRLEVEKECVALKEKAIRDGLQEGLIQLQLQILSASEVIEQETSKAKSEILTNSLLAARKIVDAELKADPSTILSIVSKTLKRVSDQKYFKLRIHPEDYETVFQNRKDLMSKLENVLELTVQNDATLTPGDVVVECPNGIVNATLDNSLKAIEEAFRRFYDRQPKEETS